MSLPAESSELVAMVQALQTQLDQSRGRERLVAERVESLMEQLQSAHSRNRHEHKENEKELKAMKRQVHKAELALIKCQQELHEARNEQEGFKVRAEHERQSKEKARQESFERARTLASNLEELEVVKRERDLLLHENETLKAVQNSINTLDTHTQNGNTPNDAGTQSDLQPSPVQQCHKCEDLAARDGTHLNSEEVEDLKDELHWLQSQLKREQDLVHFMNMQCQFRACSCRMAERAGVRFVHDHAYDRKQQDLAMQKGTKRKAEDNLPLPQYKVLRECLEQRSRERVSTTPATQSSTRAADDSANSTVSAVSMHDSYEIDEAQPDAAGEDEDLTLRAMPREPPAHEVQDAGVIPLHEAADIPLPSPRSDDLEPTLLLEDMTQVIVQPEPLTKSKHFAFSTSTSSRRAVESETPLFRQSHNAMSEPKSDDLFDLRPPRYLPPRPSTSMGLRTIDSPIRMVPPSPEHHQSLTPKTSPPRHRTTQVPLKDSPLKNSMTQRRSHSRPRSRAGPRSPTPGPLGNEANSPAAETWPITPKQKAERPQPSQAHAHSSEQLQMLQTKPVISSNVSTIPLRDPENTSKMSSHRPLEEHAHTQPLNVNLDHRGRQPLHESDPNINAQAAVLVPGTPISREAALAQIRARRDRARSIARTKQVEEGSIAKTPKSVARRGVILNREAVVRDISNLSQVSAPARF